MKIAFYYHIPIHSLNSKLWLPGYLGIFIDSLAKNVDFLYLVMHQCDRDQILDADYALKQTNIRWINLGISTPAWHRHFFHKKILKKALKSLEKIDAFIIRSPSPLAPFFQKYLKGVKLIYMIVGDYMEGLVHLKIKGIRGMFVKYYLKLNNYYFMKALQNKNLFVNSPQLFKKYDGVGISIDQIKTTTLSNTDFYQREDTCNGDLINILFTGRIDLAKGLLELLEAVFILRQEKFNLKLNIVGWEDDSAEPVTKILIQEAERYNISEHVIFHGKKKIGAELNQTYRMADIYVIPSFHEGFPRTIWEAMANCIPVIATKVGAIPHYLNDKEDSILISPHSVKEIVTAIRQVIDNQNLRKKIIKNGMKLAKENTLEIQTEKMITLIHKLISKAA